MLRKFGKLNFIPKNIDRRERLEVLDFFDKFFREENLELSFLSTELNIVLCTEVDSKLDKILEPMDVV